MDELVVINKNSKCDICGISKNDHLLYGPIYKLGNVKAHYYCVLLSNRLIQNGKDDEGMLGFLLSDILNELQRTSNIMCVYCTKGNATIQCAMRRCKKSFHLPCGLKRGSLHQFTHQFKSFCHLHRPVQNIPDKILREAYKTEIICCICYDNINVRDRKDNLWAPCCLRTWYHRYCVQKLAYNSGYFFRCAVCNDVQKFNKWMQRFGIFVPQQDASWELVPHAFEELLFRYNKCDAVTCKCPHGRKKNRVNTLWEIVLCKSCGSQGIHVACGNLKFIDPEWECSACHKITQSMTTIKKISESRKAGTGSKEMLKLSEVCQKKRRRDSDDLENSALDKRKKCRVNGEDEKEGENEIDVETIDEEPKEKSDTSAETMYSVKEFNDVNYKNVNSIQKTDFQEVLSLLKPGPLSYKLAVIQEFNRNFRRPLEKPSEKIEAKTTQSVIELVEINDSDEENENNDNVHIIMDCREQTPEESSDLTSHCRMKKGPKNENQEKSNDKNNFLKFDAEDREKQTFSIPIFDVTSACSFTQKGARK